MKIKNAMSLPEVYYGLHFSPGVAEYRESDQEPYRILINEPAAKLMDPTFEGKPVYVGHVDRVNLKNLQIEADGYVTESFYNTLDGKHWVKFIAVSDKAKDAIKAGWRLSNAYFPKTFGSGGMWHGVSYIKEVLSGEYEHLAIVNDPRYDESVIYSPEEFKLYNERKKAELDRLANEKEKPQMKFNFFKKTKVENAKEIDLENLSVVLPKSKVELTIAELVEEMDTIKNMHGYANDEHMVKCGEDEMSVKQLVKKHMDMKNKMAEMENSSEDEESEEVENEDVEADKKEKDLGEEKDEKLFPKNKKKKNSEDSEESEEVENEGSEEGESEEEVPKAAKNSKKNFNKLKNAHNNVEHAEVEIDLPADRVARGKQRYGSN
jgi:hypothetical protein